MMMINDMHHLLAYRPPEQPLPTSLKYLKQQEELNLIAHSSLLAYFPTKCTNADWTLVRQ